MLENIKESNTKLSNIEKLIFICGIALITLWGIPHTIAIRNMLLITGGFASAFYLKDIRSIFIQVRAIPLILFMCLFLWVLIHVSFFANDFKSEYSDLHSLWARVFAGVLIGVALSFLIRTKSTFNSFFKCAFFSISLVIITIYIYFCLFEKKIILPAEFLYKAIFDNNKTTSAFYSVIDVAVGSALILNEFRKKITVKSFWNIIGLLALILISLLASLTFNTKNGVGLGLGVFGALLFVLIINLFSVKDHLTKVAQILFIIFGFCIFLTISTIHHREASPGWDHLLSDIEVSIDHSKSDRWRDASAPFPTNRYGETVAGNTYERFSWISKGVELIYKHPLGYGTIKSQFSFLGWLKFDGVPYNIHSSTHSGWVDIGLSMGIPGLLLILTPLLIAIVYLVRMPNKLWWQHLSTWIAIAILPIGFLEEITYKHTFESLLFLIAFCLTSIVETPKFSVTKSISG